MSQEKRYSVDDVSRAEQIEKARQAGYQAGLDKGFKRAQEYGFKLGYSKAKDEADNSCGCGGTCKQM